MKLQPNLMFGQQKWQYTDYQHSVKNNIRNNEKLRLPVTWNQINNDKHYIARERMPVI